MRMRYYYLKKDESGSMRAVEIDRLMNCPFCGGDSLGTQHVGDSRCIAIAVECNNCDCQGPTGISSTQAETLWNTRTGEAVKDERR